MVRETQADEHDLSACALRVVDSPAACRRVIRSLDKLVTASSDPQRSSIRDELLKLAAKIQDADAASTQWKTLVTTAVERPKQQTLVSIGTHAAKVRSFVRTLVGRL